MAVVSCEIEFNSTSGSSPTPAARELTVGQKFLLICKGEWPALKSDEVELLIDKEFQYTLKLLKVDFISSQEAHLLVTSFEVGEHQLPAVQLVDKSQSVVLGDLKFTVASVQDPQKLVQEPLGPVGPLVLQLSPLYWISLSAVILLVAGWATFRWSQKRKFDKQLKSLQLESFSQSPLQQYYASLRQLSRKYPIETDPNISLEMRVQLMREVQKMVQLYLARKFQIPAPFWSPRQVLGFISKKNEFLYLDIGTDLRKFLVELRRNLSNNKAQAKIGSKDCLQLIEMSRKLVESIEKNIQKNEKEEGGR